MTGSTECLLCARLPGPKIVVNTTLGDWFLVEERGALTTGPATSWVTSSLPLKIKVGFVSLPVPGGPHQGDPSPKFGPD